MNLVRRLFVSSQNSSGERRASSRRSLGQRCTKRRLVAPEMLENRWTMSVSVTPLDINASGSSLPVYATATSLGIFFRASTPQFGDEVYISDGTTKGTRLVKDINPGTPGSSPTDFVELDGIVYFSATTTLNGTELWRTDGTDVGTWMVADVFPGMASGAFGNLFRVEDKVYFSATDGVLGLELWSTDGTPQGTKLVKDLNPGAAGSMPLQFSAFNNLLMFTATTPTSGREVWRSDGTSAGTFMLLDIATGTSNSFPGQFTAIDSLVYFTANQSGTGAELWVSDGTGANTQMVADINPGPAGSSPSQLTRINSTLYFTAGTPDQGTELWKSEGTSATTVLVADIFPGPSSSLPFWLTAVGNRLYFSATTPSEGTELWTSTGTAATTNIVKDNIPGPDSGGARDIVSINGLVFYISSTVATGEELFQTRGTPSTTTLAVDLMPGANSSNISPILPYNDILFVGGNQRQIDVEPALINTRPVVVLDNNRVGYSETGIWKYSAVKGLNNTSTRAASNPRASATWTAQPLTPGYYKVEYYKVVQPDNAATVNMQISHADGTTSIASNFSGPASAGWSELGIYRFSGRATERIRMTNATSSGLLRADAVRFTPISEPVLIDFRSPGYVETGVFTTSTIPGNAGTTTRESSTLNAAVTYSPALFTGNHLVQFYVVASASSTSNIEVSVMSARGLTTFNFNPTIMTSGWITLGQFNFEGSGSEFVKLRNALTTGTLRADAVRFFRK